MATKRVKHGEADADQAYRLQVLGAREGAIKGTLVAGTLMLLANWRYPLVRRQTLAGKSFLVMWGTIFGLVTHADKYLLRWEDEHRIASERWRNVARTELASKGVIPSETMMQDWKRQKDLEANEARAAAALANASKLEEGKSVVLEELAKVKEGAPSS
ncbi:hypothetical protein T439DRAFT_323351 [Meredithblackwellia eburnea MCA 4105]